jgi:DNA adenine methylase
LPSRFGRYYEPFLGGGSLFFLVSPRNALLSDANADLIHVWKMVQQNPQGVFDSSTEFELTPENYYRLRSAQAVDPVRRAGEFIFLNRGAFNGLYRVNRSGQFNVPWGAPRSTNIMKLSDLTNSSKLLSTRTVKIETLDFEIAINRSRPEDLVYIDPPYVTGHNNNGFVDYNEKLFSWKDQLRLAEAAERARVRGVSVIVSNAHHSEVEKLYPNFDVHILERQSNIAGNKANRGLTKEALFVGVENG